MLKDRKEILMRRLEQGRPCSISKIARDNGDNDIGFKILYLKNEEKENYRVTITKSVFSYQHGKHTANPRELTETRHMLFGIDSHNQIYAKLGFEWADYGRGFFGHGSFMAGGYLRSAGEFMTLEGKLRYVTSNSGHYLPSSRHMRHTLFLLMKSGVDLSDVTLVLYQHDYASIPPRRGRYKTAHFYNALEFMQKHELDCRRLDHKASEFKAEINHIRETTNKAIGMPDSPENQMPHRLTLA